MKTINMIIDVHNNTNCVDGCNALINYKQIRRDSKDRLISFSMVSILDFFLIVIHVPL